MFRFDGFLIFCSFLMIFFSVRRVLVLDLEPRWCACVPWWCCQVVVEVQSSAFLLAFLSVLFVTNHGGGMPRFRSHGVEFLLG